MLKVTFLPLLAGMTPSILNDGMKEDGLSIKSNLLPNENQVHFLKPLIVTNNALAL